MVDLIHVKLYALIEHSRIWALALVVRKKGRKGDGRRDEGKKEKRERRRRG